VAWDSLVFGGVVVLLALPRHHGRKAALRAGSRPFDGDDVQVCDEHLGDVVSTIELFLLEELEEQRVRHGRERHSVLVFAIELCNVVSLKVVPLSYHGQLAEFVFVLSLESLTESGLESLAVPGVVASSKAERAMDKHWPQ
jgi:hypothetical protein